MTQAQVAKIDKALEQYSKLLSNLDALEEKWKKRIANFPGDNTNNRGEIYLKELQEILGKIPLT